MRQDLFKSMRMQKVDNILNQNPFRASEYYTGERKMHDIFRQIMYIIIITCNLIAQEEFSNKTVISIKNERHDKLFFYWHSLLRIVEELSQLRIVEELSQLRIVEELSQLRIVMERVTTPDSRGAVTTPDSLGASHNSG